MSESDAQIGAGISGEIVTLGEVIETEDAPGDTSTTYVVAGGDTVYGTIESYGEQDWYALTIDEPSFVTITLDGDPSNGDDLIDPYLYIYDEAGVIYLSNDDSGGDLNSALDWWQGDAGTFYVAADAYADNHLGDYVITITVTAVSDLPELALGIPETGTVSSAGVDYYQFRVTAGETYIFSMSDLDTDAVDLDPFLQLFEVDGTFLLGDDDSGDGEDAMIAYAATSDGVVVIAAQDAFGGVSGTYDLVVSTEIRGDALTEASLSDGETASSVLELAGDSDWYAVTIAAATTYVVRMEDRTGAEDLPIVPMLYDADGDPVAVELTQFGNSGVFYVSDLPAGTYFVAAASSDPTATGAYDIFFGSANLLGTDADETLSGGDGVDVILAEGGADSVLGGAGDDNILAGGASDTVQGEAGNDAIDGGKGDDHLQGDDGDDFVFGGGGNDTAVGGADRDILNGGANDDVLEGGDGNDTLYGGTGRGTDLLDGQEGDDVLHGENGEDTLYGGDGFDDLYGGKQDDELYGGAAADTLQGEAGDDLLEGEDGNDSLIGNGGNDTLVGGSGDDTMKGNGGADVFKVGNGNDLIRDFDVTADELHFASWVWGDDIEAILATGVVNDDGLLFDNGEGDTVLLDNLNGLSDLLDIVDAVFIY